jgi:hypothetical protein
MGRPLLMMTEANFLAPLDYRHLLKVYADADEAVRRADEWMTQHLADVADAVRRGIAAKTRLRLATELSSIRLGEPVAEMEEETLVEYFIETAAFRTVLSASTTVFVGRKGTGKTANLLRSAQVLEADRRNVVCVIQPAGYELNGLVRLLKRYSERDEKGYLVESLWKFLILSEVALTVYRRIESRAVAPEVGTSEWDFVSYLREHDFMLQEFAVRLEQAVDSILQRTSGDTITDARAAISEELHVGILRELRRHLGRLLHNAERVAVLIDNLDKAWEKSADVNELAYLLLGLLNAVGPIAREFSRTDRWRDTIRLSVAVFLRSDIFSEVQRVAPEPDRLPITRLLWDDRELLLRIIEDRYRAARNEEVEGSELWAKFFIPAVNGVPVRDHVISRVLPRPRDLLYYCNAAIASAVNRGHSIVEVADLEDAERTYSFFALEALKVEAGVVRDRVEEVLYEFAGADAVMGYDAAMGTIRRAVSSDDEAQALFDVLRSFSYFGLETSPGRFSYAEEPAERARDEALARRFSERHGRQPLVQIHPAFRRYLEINEEAA